MKLVRDRIPELFPDAGKYRQVTPNEADLLLLAKAVEELGEFFQAGTPEEIAEELADVLEVLLELADRAGVTQEQVALARAAKKRNRGGFKDGWVLE